MKNFFLPLAFCLAVCSFAAQAMDSAYTSLEEKSCKMLESSADNPQAEIDYFTMSCAGRDGYEVKVSGGDSRSWLVLLKSGQPVYDSMNDINANVKGQFPNITGKVLEWRYDNKKSLQGLIVRVNAQDENKPEKSISELFVFRHNNGSFCYLGTHKTNEGARKIVDSKASCKP
jgi:hypothetical protein